MSARTVRVEEKLYQNRYVVDAGRGHINVAAHEKPSANLLAMTICARPAATR